MLGGFSTACWLKAYSSQVSKDSIQSSHTRWDQCCSSMCHPLMMLLGPCQSKQASASLVELLLWFLLATELAAFALQLSLHTWLASWLTWGSWSVCVACTVLPPWATSSPDCRSEGGDRAQFWCRDTKLGTVALFLWKWSNNSYFPV